DDLRTQPAACSTVVSRKPLGSFSSSPIAYLPLIPFQAAATPVVGVRDADEGDENQHFDKAEDPEGVEVDRPRVEKDDFDVEDDEEHRREVVLDRETPAARRLRSGLDAALVRLELGPVLALG